MRAKFVPLVAGIALGATDSVVNHVAGLRGDSVLARSDRGGLTQAAEFLGMVLDAAWAWAAVAVLVGWVIARRGARLPASALAGAVVLLAATAVYYGVDALFDGGGFWHRATKVWLVCAVILGPLLGAVGALTRRPGTVGMLAGMVVPVCAVLNMGLWPPQHDSPMARPVVGAVWLGAALTTAVVFLRGRSKSADAGAP
ncbi:hypothetical protein HH310_21065 [Actinoplanes sp. TBRC 11911]|uniref:DUF6518 family protein n=1 Tax=Actinoplanes sp. TBRC 11911 TaxID=2729386 RepID=UPI00145E2D5B|nr:DUF6518 family protein [Actinoplanes sp. TBRC 11911]NMO53665.1 hypothetical protein [Actinoplanes sp. TBRC 11911]